LSEFEDKLSKKMDLIETMAQSIKDELFINTVIHCCKLDEYDRVKEEWIEKINDADKGAEIDPYSVLLFAAIHVASILHVLANIKNPDELMKYEVPGEGTYTIEKVKDKWVIGFVAGKEFKQAIKNDRLVDTMS
jgi:hypothetical protein